MSMVEVSRRLGLSLSGIGQSVKHGEELAQGNNYKLIDL